MANERLPMLSCGHDNQENGSRQRRRRRPCSCHRFLHRARHGARRRDGVEGPWVDRVNGLEGVQVDIAMMRTLDGHGRLELTKFHHPELVEIAPAIAPPNALGLRSVMFAVDSVDDAVARLRAPAPNSSARWPSTRTCTGCATCAAPLASSSRWPRNSAEAFHRLRSNRWRPKRSFDASQGDCTHQACSPDVRRVFVRRS